MGGGCGDFLCCVCLWCGQCWRFCVLCVFVALVLVAAVVVQVVCVVCARVRVWCVGGVLGCLPSPLRAWVGGSVWVLSPLFLLAALPCVLLPWCLFRDYPGCGGCVVRLGMGGGGA